jgi:hypothetical protein
MIKRNAGVLAVLVGCGWAWAIQPAKHIDPPAPARQPEAKAPAAKQPEVKESEKKEPRAMAVQAPEYKLMADMCGTFDLKMTVTPQPGMKPIVMNATATRQMVLGGKFMEEKVEATGPMPFSTISYMGFNAAAKDGPRFEVTRMGNSASCMMPERGTYDAAKKMLTLSGEHEIDGMAGKIRNEINLAEMDHQVVESSLSYEGYAGQYKGLKVPEYHAMTMEYTRKK